MAKQRVRVSYNPVAHLALVFICLSLTGVASSLGNLSVVIVIMYWNAVGFFWGRWNIYTFALSAKMLVPNNNNNNWNASSDILFCCL